MSAPAVQPVALLLSRFPLITETFILREAIELERQGQPVVLVPLIRERPAVVHPEAEPWVGRALYTPWLSAAVVASNLRALATRPGAWLGTLARLVFHSFTRPGVLARGLALFPKAVHLARLLPARGVTHLHAHYATHPATVAWVVERLSGLPYSLTVHAHDLFVDRTMLGAKLVAARFVRAISRYNRDFLAARHPEAAGRLTVVHVGVEVARYEAAGEANRGSTAGPLRLLTVAALKPYKGLDVLLEAAVRLRPRREVRWEIVGDGPLRRRLEGEIGRRGLDGEVTLAGAVPQAEVARRLAAADLFVLPSVVAADGQMEGIPVALMEAMAAGLPVVASRLSGIPELIDGGVDGLLVEPGDPEALAAAVERLADDPALAARLGAAGRDKVRRDFELATTVGELRRLLDQARGGGEAPLARVATGALADAGLGTAASCRPLHDGPDSRVAEVVTAGERGERGRVVIVKQHRDRPGASAPAAERARRELELLRRLAAAGDGRFTVPAAWADRPLGDGGRVVLMAAAEGTRLDGLLRRWRWRFGGAARRRLAAAGRACGGWIAWFQRAAAPGEGRVAVHGDLWPGNLFLTLDGGRPVRVTAIDLEAAHPAPVDGGRWDDAADLLLHAERYFSLPFPWPGLSRRFEAFAAGVAAGLLGLPEGDAPPADERAALAEARRRRSAAPGPEAE